MCGIREIKRAVHNRFTTDSFAIYLVDEKSSSFMDAT